MKDKMSVSEFNKMKVKKPRNKHEESLSLRVCKYLDLKYPNLVYSCDLSGIKLPIGLATKAAKQRCKNYKILDLTIYAYHKDYGGLIIELKKDRDEVYCKDGTMRQSEHIQAQYKSIEKLRNNGYSAHFGCGFDETIKIIENYLK